MRDRGCHFSQHRHARHVREFRLRFVQLRLGLFGRGDVDNRPDVLELTRLIPASVSHNTDEFD
jgi:hypothetical protein